MSVLKSSPFKRKTSKDTAFRLKQNHERAAVFHTLSFLVYREAVGRKEEQAKEGNCRDRKEHLDLVLPAKGMQSGQPSIAERITAMFFPLFRSPSYIR